MAAQHNVNKYQFHKETDFDRTSFLVYKGDKEVGGLHVTHRDEHGYEWDEDNGPAPHRVSGMKFAKGHSAAAMTAVGIAAENAVAAGSKLTPDDDLSKHSSKLVQGLQRRGLVTESADTNVTNQMDFMDEWHAYPEDRQGERLTTGTVSRGRRFIRDAIYAGKWHR